MSTLASPPLVATPAAPRPPLRPTPRMSADEFFAWARANDVRAEWVAGEVQFKMPVTKEHDEYQRLLCSFGELLAKRRGLGTVSGSEFAVWLPGRPSWREPDVTFVAAANQARLSPTRCDGSPDLILEVVSPESTSRDYREKFLEYQAARVREYWLVNPMAETIEAYRLDPATGEYVLTEPDADGLLRSVVLDGFVLRPATFFAKPIPDLLTFMADLGVTP